MKKTKTSDFYMRLSQTEAMAVNIGVGFDVILMPLKVS
jgi:hypothetical protein